MTARHCVSLRRSKPSSRWQGRHGSRSGRARWIFSLGTRSRTLHASSQHPRASRGQYPLGGRNRKASARPLFAASPTSSPRPTHSKFVEPSTLNSQHPTDQLRSALTNTVHHHLVADVPVGVFLSSGLDSTTLAAFAAEQGGTLRTVTLGFEEFKGTTADETPLAEQFARQRAPRIKRSGSRAPISKRERERLFASMDQPSTDGVNTFFVSLAARRADLKVALSGLGGDELFAGYPSFHEIPKTVSCAALVSSLAALRPNDSRTQRQPF